MPGPQPERDGVARVLLTGAAAGAVGVLLVVVGAGSLGLSSDAPRPARIDKLYNVPNWVHDRTTSHFPQNEANWLKDAASGRIGDDEKDEETKKQLDGVIQEWHDRAKDEKKSAFAEAAIKAREENYFEYNTTLGKALLHPVASSGTAATSSAAKQKLTAGHEQTKTAPKAGGTSSAPASTQKHLVAPAGAQALAGWSREQEAIERIQAKAEHGLKKELKQTGLGAKGDDPLAMVRDDAGEEVPAETLRAEASALGYSSVQQWLSAEARAKKALLEKRRKEAARAAAAAAQAQAHSAPSHRMPTHVAARKVTSEVQTAEVVHSAQGDESRSASTAAAERPIAARIVHVSAIGPINTGGVHGSMAQGDAERKWVLSKVTNLIDSALRTKEQVEGSAHGSRARQQALYEQVLDAHGKAAFGAALLRGAVARHGAVRPDDARPARGGGGQAQLHDAEKKLVEASRDLAGILETHTRALAARDARDVELERGPEKRDAAGEVPESSGVQALYRRLKRGEPLGALQLSAVQPGAHAAAPARKTAMAGVGRGALGSSLISALFRPGGSKRQ